MKSCSQISSGLVTGSWFSRKVRQKTQLRRSVYKHPGVQDFLTALLLSSSSFQDISAMGTKNLALLALTLICTSTSLAFVSKTNCPCGWQLADGSARFTNRLYHDFSQFPSATDITSNPKAKQFSQLWDINNYTLRTNDPVHAHDQRFISDNVIFSDGYLQLIQPGYSAADAAANNPVQIAGIQTKTLDILHGSFRIEIKITGSNGGAVGSFFWYHVSLPLSHLRLLLKVIAARTTHPKSTSRS